MQTKREGERRVSREEGKKKGTKIKKKNKARENDRWRESRMTTNDKDEGRQKEKRNKRKRTVQEGIHFGGKGKRRKKTYREGRGPDGRETTTKSKYVFLNNFTPRKAIKSLRCKILLRLKETE